MSNTGHNPFEIDPHALHVEWLRQAGLTREAGRREADARHVYAQAKARCEVVAARIKSLIRRSPGRYDLPDRPTIDQVESTLLVLPEYQQVLEEVNLAKRDLDYATADTVAYVDRRKALEGLVELLRLDYYSERGEPRPATAAGRELIEEMAEEARRAVRRASPGREDGTNRGGDHGGA